jgi:hypothetical protein
MVLMIAETGKIEPVFVSSAFQFLGQNCRITPARRSRNILRSAGLAGLRRINSALKASFTRRLLEYEADSFEPGDSSPGGGRTTLIQNGRYFTSFCDIARLCMSHFWYGDGYPMLYWMVGN